MARKEKKAGLPTMGLVSVGLICLFIAAAGCSFIWNKNQIHSLGQQIRFYEAQLETAKRRRLTLERTYATMCSPADLEERVKRMNLHLGPPQPDQMVRLFDGPPEMGNARFSPVATGAHEDQRGFHNQGVGRNARNAYSTQRIAGGVLGTVQPMEGTN